MGIFTSKDWHSILHLNSFSPSLLLDLSIVGAAVLNDIRKSYSYNTVQAIIVFRYNSSPH